MTTAELINVGLSDAGNDKLDYLKDQGYFAEKMDAYRFAVGLALAQGAIPPEISKRVTFLNVGSLDPEQKLRRAVEALMPDQVAETTVYRLIERLADWVLANFMRRLHGATSISLPSLSNWLQKDG